MTHPANKLRTHNDAARNAKASVKKGKEEKEAEKKGRKTRYGQRLDRLRGGK